MIRYLALNLLIAIGWILFWGRYDIYMFVAGFVIGYLILVLVSRLVPGPNYGVRLIKISRYGLYFIRILIQANLQVMREAITPGFQMTPRFVRYPVEGMTDLQITSLANSITLTPGTLSVDVTPDGKYLYVHCMYAKDRAEAVRGLDELRDRVMGELFS